MVFEGITGVCERMNEKERRICELEIMAGTFFFRGGRGGGTPSFS